MRPARILFIGNSCIGDAVIASSVLNRIVQEWPESSITIATPPRPAVLYEAIPQVKTVWILPKKSFSRHWIQLWRLAVPSRWDLICDMRGSGVGFLLRAKAHRINWGAPPSDLHRVQKLENWWHKPSPLLKGSWSRLQNLSCLRHNALPFEPKIWVNAEDTESISNLPTSPLVFAPAAGWPEKQWSAHGFAALHQRLAAHGTHNPLILIASGPERHICEDVARLIPVAINLAGQLSLRQIAALLWRSALFVGNDSGLMHMAAATGCPTVGLFGPTRAENYAPYGIHTRTVRTPESYETLMHLMKKPTYQKGSAMANLSVEKVFAACQDLLLLKKAYPSVLIGGR